MFIIISSLSMFQEIMIFCVVRRSKSVTNLSSNLQLTDLIWKLLYVDFFEDNLSVSFYTQGRLQQNHFKHMRFYKKTDNFTNFKNKFICKTIEKYFNW